MASTTIGNVIADFSTVLVTAVAVGATTATLTSATDKDSVALPTGTYYFTLDGASISGKEYIKCTLTGTALTAIQHISRQGVLSTGFTLTHRKGATVTITDFASIRKMADLLDGTTSNADMTFTDIAFTGTTTAGLKVKSLTTAQRTATTPANGNIVYDTDLGVNYQYIGGAWTTFASGSVVNASATVAGKVEIATSAESIAGTDTGGTGALLSVLPSDIMKNTQSGAGLYGTDAGGDDTYVVALTPVLTTYTTGQTLSFTPVTANTGACTVDFGAGVKSLKTLAGNDPADGDIVASKICVVKYDGTNMVVQKPSTSSTSEAGLAEKATNVEATAGTDTDRFVTPAQLLASSVYSVNANENVASYWTYQIPIIASSSTAIFGWSLASVGILSVFNSGSYTQLGSTGNDFTAQYGILGLTYNTTYDYSSNKIIRIKFRASINDLSDRKGFGLAVTAANIHTAQTDTTNGEIRFIWNAGVLYAQNANGTATSTDISSGVTGTNFNTYEIVFSPGVDIKYYVNGTLKATHITNLPTTGIGVLVIGVSNNGRVVNMCPIMCSIQI